MYQVHKAMVSWTQLGNKIQQGRHAVWWYWHLLCNSSLLHTGQQSQFQQKGKQSLLDSSEQLQSQQYRLYQQGTLLLL